MSPRVGIVILIWNGKADTLECLDSLSHDRYANKEIIIVDNGSTDGSADEIRKAFPGVIILETGANLGFTGGNNVGIQHAVERGTDFLYLLNNDTTVEPDALSELVAAAEAEPRFGLLAPVIHEFYPPRPIWFADSKMDLPRGAAWHDNTRQPQRTEPPFTVPWATGCAMLIRTQLMHTLGGFDERYYLSWEDVDLCVRVRQAGLEIVTVPAARIYHKGGRSGLRMSGVQHYYAVRNTLLLMRKHSGAAYYRAAPGVVLSFLWRTLRARMGPRDRMECLRSVLDGVHDHLTAHYGPYHAAREKRAEPVAA